MARKIITLLTDFGWEDGYVAEMKGVILTRCPGVELVDITHDIPVFDIFSGAQVLGRVFSRFPKGTIHLAVVDPGVGGPRKPLMLFSQGHYFVGPDNGLLTVPVSGDAPYQVFEITRWGEGASATFHGRDIFAPAAAGLASGLKPSRLGHPLARIERLSDFEPKAVSHGKWEGKVIGIDHFGNIATNFSFAFFSRLHHPIFYIGKFKITHIIKTFSEGRPGQLAILNNSDSRAEVVLPSGSAQSRLRIKKGEKISLFEGEAPLK
jgi:S-adenosylmethionine hydrolase